MKKIKLKKITKKDILIINIQLDFIPFFTQIIIPNKVQEYQRHNYTLLIDGKIINYFYLSGLAFFNVCSNNNFRRNTFISYSRLENIFTKGKYFKNISYVNELKGLICKK